MILARLSRNLRSFSVFKSKFSNYSTEKHEIKRECLPISRFPVPKKEELPSDIQSKFDTVEEKSGFIPNVFKVLAHRPDEFRAFFNYYDVLMDSKRGSLTKAEKELIVVATSTLNHCLYCVVAHSALHRIYSKNPYVADQVAANWQSANLTNREKAIVEFSLDIAHMRHVSEQKMADLQAHGLSSEDIWDIGAVAAFFALSNRMAHLTAMKPNEEFYTLGRIPRTK